MKILLASILSLFFMSMLPVESDFNKCKNSEYILNQSKKKHDSKSHWNQSEINFHIQEPRVGNPQRFSKIKLNNATDYFEIERNRAEGLEKRTINEQGKCTFSLNGSEEIPEEIQEKYGINKESTEFRKIFYQTLYGLPMSLTDDMIVEMKPAESIVYEDRDAYRVNIELKNSIISKHWGLLISTKDFKLLALEFNHPDDPDSVGEIIKFEGLVKVKGMELPRIRHWYEQGSDEYLGSDIIVEQID